MGPFGPYPSSGTKQKTKEKEEQINLNPYSRLTEVGTWPELYRKYGKRILNCGEWQREYFHRGLDGTFQEDPHLARDFYKERVWTGSVLNYRESRLEWDVKINDGILYKKMLDPYDVVEKVGRHFDLNCEIPRSSTKVKNLTERYHKFLQRLFMSPMSRLGEFADSNFWVLNKPQDRMIILRGGSYPEREDIFVVSMFSYRYPARIRN